MSAWLAHSANRRGALLLCLAALAGLASSGSGSGLGAVALARGSLVLAVVGTGAFFLWRRRGGLAGAPRLGAIAPRVQVLSRASLAPRCGVALLEVEGQQLLVVHGDGYAQVTDLAARSGESAR